MENITIQQITSDDNLLCSLDLKLFNLKAFLVYQGTDKVKYFVFRGEKLFFAGNDFRPAPMHGIDSLEAITSLLGFICVGIHDTESEYFKEYTPEQLEWAKGNGDREQLSGLLSDLDNSAEPKHQASAKRYFKRNFNTL